MFCRLCLTEPTFENYLNIFEENGESLAQIIAQHFSFEPRIDDSHKIICKICWEILENFHNFYTRIEDAQKHFKHEIFVKSESTLLTGNDLKSESIGSEKDIFVEPQLERFENIYSEIKSVDPNELENNTVNTTTTRTENKIQIKKLKKKQNVLYSDVDSELKNKRPKKLIKIIMKKPNPSMDKNSTVELSDENNMVSDETDLKISKFMQLRCDVCLKDLQTFTEVKRHFRAEHKMLGYVICCEKKFTSRAYFSDHIDAHSNPNEFKCKICNRIQTNRRRLRQHMKEVHETAKKFECDICFRKVSHKFALELHKYTHIPVEERAFKCTDCEKTFASEYQMKKHWSKVHEVLASNICCVCGKVIKDKVLFEKHQLEHEGIVEPKAQCEICGVWLKNSTVIAKHVQNMHSEKKDFICPICNKVCKSGAALKSHKFYYHSCRLYPCSVCGKEFRQKVLKEHMSTHTGEALYTCPHCPKTFISHANLHHHRKKMHRKEWEETRAKKRLQKLSQ